MNVGVLLLGLVGGVVIGVGIELQSRAARRRAERLARDGVIATGTITTVESTGRYGAYRRLTVAVDGGSFVETVPFVEAGDAGLVEGASVAVRVLPENPADGRIDRPADPPPRVPLGVVVGLFIAALGVAAALVV